jgi:hypothetical protein
MKLPQDGKSRLNVEIIALAEPGWWPLVRNPIGECLSTLIPLIVAFLIGCGSWWIASLATKMKRARITMPSQVEV